MKIRAFIATAVCAAFALGALSNFQTASASGSARSGAARCAVPEFENAFRQSKAVFTGEVVGEEKTGDVRAFDFRLEKYWKGANAKIVRIYVYETTRYQAWFKKGGKYLVYAPSDDRGRLRVSRCSRSRDVESAAADLQRLGKGKIPR